MRKSMLKRVRLVVFGTVECSLRSREDEYAPRGRYDANVRLELEWFLRLRLLARLLLYLFGRLLSPGLVPLLVVIACGAVPYGRVEVLRINAIEFSDSIS